MPKFHSRRISDPVHGTFGLSQLEADIISTGVFQRLHNVKQLGLAHLVYPGADYSRFSHSLGACHLAGRILRAIQQNCPYRKIRDEEIQLYRLAGLLHDLGHYPFSHATEQIIADHYKGGAYLEGGDPPTDEPASYDHENLGRAIIDNDEELGGVLAKHNFSKADLKSLFSRERPEFYTNIVSSDLDCDRLDYLVRSARATGLPYGVVDVEYITSQMCLDNEDCVCLTGKAMRAADHLLVSRHYDYTQVVYHKTVVGLELVLKAVLRELLKGKLLDCSGAFIKSEISSGKFRKYDDHFIIAKIREFRASLDPQKEPVTTTKIDALLNRIPPKLLVAYEKFDPRGEANEREHRNKEHQIKELIPKWAKQFGINEQLWYLWRSSPAFSKIGSHVAVGEDAATFEEEKEQAIRVLIGNPADKNSKSKLLVSCESALMSRLADLRLYYLRLFVHLPVGADGKVLQERIVEQIKRDLPDFPFA